MTRKEELAALLSKVKLEDHRVGMWEALSDPLHPHVPEYARQAFLGDLAAAKRLHDAVLPNWTVSVTQNMWHLDWKVYVTFINDAGAAIERGGYSACDDNNPARAWLIAIIRGLEVEATIDDFLATG